MALRFVPAHLERLGASPSAIGDVMAASTLGGLLALPVVGLLVQRHPRAVLVGGAFIQGAGLTLAGVLGGHAGSLGVAMGLMSVGTATLDVGVTSAIVSTVPPDKRAMLLAYYFTFVNLSRNIAGSAIAEGLMAYGGFGAMVFTLAAVAGGHGVLRGLVRVPEPPTPPPRPALGEYLARLRRPRVVLLLVVFTLLAINFVAQESFLSAMASARDLGAVTPFFAAYFVVIAVGRVLSGHTVDRLGRGVVVLLSGCLLLGLGAGLAVVSVRPALLALGLLSGLGHLLVWPALYATFYDKLPGRGLVTATLNAAMAAAGFIAELGLGRLATGHDYAALYWAAGGAAALAAVLVVPLVRWMSPCPES